MVVAEVVVAVVVEVDIVVVAEVGVVAVVDSTVTLVRVVIAVDADVDVVATALEVVGVSGAKVASEDSPPLTCESAGFDPTAWPVVVGFDDVEAASQHDCNWCKYREETYLVLLQRM